MATLAEKMAARDAARQNGDSSGQAAALMERMQDDRRDPNTVHLMRDQIIVKPQAREKLGDLQSLANSIKEFGQDHAIVVTPTANPHVFELSKGERRYFAIFDILKHDTIRAYIDRSGIQNDRVKHRLGQLHENIQRKEYEPFELAKEFQALIEETGWNQDRLAEKVGVSKGWVSKKLSLLKAPPEIRAAIESGELAETDYYNNKEQAEQKATKREKPGEGGEAGTAAKLPKKFSMPWNDAAALGSLLIGFLRERHPGEFGDFVISEDSSPEEVAAFYESVKRIWYPRA